MGHLKPFTMIGRAPEGTCPECAIKHNPKAPHDVQSLFYQYKFYDGHGRFPTWVDAMEHCTNEVKAMWTEELRKLGMSVDVK